MISFRTETSNVGNTINAFTKVDLSGGGTIYIYIRVYIYMSTTNHPCLSTSTCNTIGTGEAVDRRTTQHFP